MHEHLDPLLLEFLRNPESYPHRPHEVRELHTHASLVFLVPPFVYKIKKPVDFGFLDFSTLEKRRHFCQREVELNSRLAPGIYLGVETITREDGGFAFGGSGEPVEYAVRMRLLSGDGFLDSRIRAGTAGEAELERVAAVLAEFYQNQPSPPEVAEWGAVGKLRISTVENFSQTSRFVGGTITRASYDAIRSFVEACYERRRALFGRRMAGGWIRDCHGDLHLEHVHVTEDALHIYDCIEFNDRFRHLDIASDVAFLAMDLDYHGRPDLSAFFVRRVAGLVCDQEMESLMDFYQCYRAYVRGKVESLRSVAEIAGWDERDEAGTRARRYFQLALQYAVCGTKPLALVFMGRVASGKSTLAGAVARELGWRVVSSDVVRKTMAMVPLHERADEECRRSLYSPGMTDAVYETMIDAARDTLRSGHGVIIDATFSRRSCRDRLREMLGEGSVIWLVMEADEADAARRLMERDQMDGVVSDARIGDHQLLNDAFEEPDELPCPGKFTVRTDTDVETVLRKLLVELAAARA